MTTTVFNPTTGRYVTTVTAAAAKQVAQGSPKTVAGTKVPLSALSNNTTKVSISAQAQQMALGGLPMSLSEFASKLPLSNEALRQLPPIRLLLNSNLSELTVPTISAGVQTALQTLASDAGGKKIAAIQIGTGTTQTLDLTTLAAVPPNLLKIVANPLSVDLPAAPDTLITQLPAATLSKLKTLGQANKIVRATINGENPALNVQASSVSALGANILARLSNKITVEARPATLKGAWEDIRLLNNFSDVTLEVDNSIDPTSGFQASLPSGSVSLRYDQFVAGFGVASNIAAKSVPSSFGTTVQDRAGTATQGERQSALIFGSFNDGDEFDLAIAPPGGNVMHVKVGPLNVGEGASPKEQAAAFLSAVKATLAASPAFSEGAVTASMTGNKITFDWQVPAPADGSLVSFTKVTAGKSTGPLKIDLTDVPAHRAKALTNYAQVKSLSITDTSSEVINNSDELTQLTKNGFIKDVFFTDSNDLQLSSSAVKRSVSVLGRVAGLQFSLKESPKDLLSYGSFTREAAMKLKGGVSLKGSLSDFITAREGLKALAAAGRLQELTVTQEGIKKTVKNPTAYDLAIMASYFS